MGGAEASRNDFENLRSTPGVIGAPVRDRPRWRPMKTTIQPWKPFVCWIRRRTAQAGGLKWIVLSWMTLAGMGTTSLAAYQQYDLFSLTEESPRVDEPEPEALREACPGVLMVRPNGVDGGWQIRAQVPLGMRHQLETSLNLKDWLPLGDPVVPTEPLLIRDLPIHQGALGYFRLSSQPLQLGEAWFDCHSDDPGLDRYWPIPVGTTVTYAGYGKYQGYEVIESYHSGGTFHGVKTVRQHTQGNHPSDTWTEDWWLARDRDGNLRVLKLQSEGGMAYEVAAGATPALVFPRQPDLGVTWEFLGIDLNISGVAETFRGFEGLRVLEIDTGEAQPDRQYYQRGLGIVAKHWNDQPAPGGSGWVRTSPL